jgi:hypothetical protein
MAAAFPLSFAAEAACSLGEGDGEMPPPAARLAIANATQRLLSDDADCTPAAPARFSARLETLARRWIKANPVTALFDALTDPTLDETAISVQPSATRAGGVLTLSLETAAVADPSSLVAMFTPHVPAEIVRTRKEASELSIVAPAGAQSGHVAVVRRRGADQFAQVNALMERYQADFEAEWMLGVFSFVPLQEWCYPIAFTRSPWIQITQLPVRATVQVFDAAGRRTEARPVKVNEAVTVTYSVYPPGSDANAPLAISATNGTIRALSKPCTYLYRPANRGTGQIRLAWGGLTVTANVTVGE